MTAPSADEILGGYKQDVLKRLRGHRRLVEKALAQVSDEAFFRTPSPESNSIAVVVKHLAGNMRSRFTDFLTSDGEKPDRDRDGEFEVDGGAESRDELMRAWSEGWDRVLGAVEPLSAEDLGRTITIRSEPHTVVGALNRHLAHFAYHAGQIAYLAKLWAGDGWKTLSIPKRGSAEYFEAQRKKHES